VEKRWIGLPRRTRREVMRLAREGSRHPDAGVASVANDWAQSLVKRPSYRLLVRVVYEIAGATRPNSCIEELVIATTKLSIS
jgi:hypothetical protein